MRRRCVGCCCADIAARFHMLLCCADRGPAGSTLRLQDANRASVGLKAVVWLCMCAEHSGVAGTGWQRSCLGSGAGLAAAGPACALMSKLSWCPG